MNRSTRASSSTSLAEPFRAIAELGGDVAFVVDCRSGALLYMSAFVDTMLGYTPADFRAQLRGATPDGPLAGLCAGLEGRLRRFAAGDVSCRQLVHETSQRHRDGRLVPLEIASSILVDEIGNATELVGTLRNLSQRDAQHTSQRRFASMLNHEFRTPLSTIDGAIQRLEASSADVDDATRARYRKIGAAVDRLIGMLDTYLSPEQLDAIGQTARVDTLDLAALLADAARQARAAGRVVDVNGADLPAAIRCEPDGLRMAFKVLLDNALLYSPADTALRVSGQRADGGIVLCVRDFGAGVPDAERDSIFGKHVRGSNIGATAGSGLGLYMARAVVEVHGGSLTVRGGAGGGAEFRLWLPAQGGAGKTVALSVSSSDNSSNQ